ncbi:MAG TPA: FAD-binding and (Fe-S)-binding domain-containing protein [Lacunisphaera sp.]|jgi:FAD/FMN-containing dehydrogenase/Fe-S oxidoreductase|nr:FAD-binding and (Fe-S)-binding domain-containing protein [Lacunisphaera sp.]
MSVLTTESTPGITSRPARSPSPVDVPALERDLRAETGAEVRFDEGARALYATDASNYRQPPIGVVLPRTRADVIAIVRVCSRHGAPLLSRGGGTSLAGQCCNFAVVMDHSRHYNQVLSIDPGKRLARVQPGVVLDRVQEAAAAHGLIFGPNPATHDHCTIGGMIGNNSCGINSLLSRNHGLGLRTSDNLEALEVLTYDGTILRLGPATEADFDAAIAAGGRTGDIYRRLKGIRERFAGAIGDRFPKIPRRVSGYNLDDLLPGQCNLARAVAGSEGTCVVILEATLKLVPRPKSRGLLVLGYPDAFAAGHDVKEILPARPIGLEGVDHLLVEFMREHHMHRDALQLLPEGRGWLLVEFGGDTREDCHAQASRVQEKLRRAKAPPHMKYYDDPAQMKIVWEAREAGLGATAFVKGKPDFWPGWEDSAVDPADVGDYLRDLRSLFDRYHYEPALYGHYGQGCIHCRVDFDLVDADGLRHYHDFVEEAADLVIRYGGSFSGEHGDGQSRGELLPKLFGPELMDAFRQFKGTWDPTGKMNPGKVVDPYGILEHLRLGPNYRPPQPATHFSFRDDQGSFSRAALRCVGVGKCRHAEGGTMCPSYMVTRDEMHSTRGRAHLLFEMLQGELLPDGWRSRPVKDALDLCLSCKGCKGDCPVHVDMATYKAEFLAHYYHHRLRPPHAYAFGLIGRWAPLGAAFPRLSNFLLGAPGLRSLIKGLIGVAPARQIPRFATESFKHWFFRRTPVPATGPRVLLWPDTFNNHYHPEVARAATRFLERHGWQVVVPRVHLCCGRPLYDYGMLDTARRWLERILDELRDDIRAGTPLIGLEPSCTAVFRDELPNLLPHDEDALRLSHQTLLLSEFIQQRMPEAKLPYLAGRALVHGHCHQKALMKMTSEEHVLRRLGVGYEILDSGCCGMAGAFGFEKDHYDVSIACGERVLLPRVRAAEATTHIVANGFSCREQIRQTTDRGAIHLAQLLELAGNASGVEKSQR